MTVRPSDLEGSTDDRALRCGECLVDYPAARELYEWMFDSDTIVCAACGAELVVVDKVTAEA